MPRIVARTNVYAAWPAGYKAWKHLSDEGFAELLLAVVVINGWNRINVTAHVAPAE